MNPTESVDLPPRIARLRELAYDLWWTWHPSAREVFRKLDYALWRQTAHNPVSMLGRMTSDAFERAAVDPQFLGYYDAAVIALDGSRNAGAVGRNWWAETLGTDAAQPVAYFSA